MCDSRDSGSSKARASIGGALRGLRPVVDCFSTAVLASALSVAALPAAPAAAGAPAGPIFFDGFEDAGTRGWNLTVPSSCTDGRKTGDETDVDCGGASCVSCAAVCPAPAFGELGGPCDSDDDCGTADSHCYFGPQGTHVFAPEGYCKVDDFSLPQGNCASDAECPAGSLCTEWLEFSGYRTCMPSCTCAGAACAVHQLCTNSFVGLQLGDAVCTPGRAGALDGAACAGVFECDEYSSCLADTEYPGGECERRDCTIGDDSTCNGGHCIAGEPGSGVASTCVDPCTSAGDCRTADGYVCFDPDGGGSAPNYCRHPHVGDACAIPADCGGGSWDCRTGASFPGGYCTLVGCPLAGVSTGCTAGSVCFDDGPVFLNFCVDRCTGPAGQQGSCRTGYLCNDVDPGGATVLGCTPPS